MKKIISILYFLLSFTLNAQVGIGTTTPDASSVLDITSTEAGMLIPRMTQTDRDNITSPATGLLIYQTNNSSGFYYYNSAIWISIGAGDKNTLDEAYDQGGLGAGKTIDATDGAVTINGEDGFLITGTLSSGNTIDTEVTGAGTRLFFNPRKAAFRTGSINGVQWDDANIGVGSAAIGMHGTASNYASIALGSGSIASGTSSTAMGSYTEASGQYSTAMGRVSLASGITSTAIGSFAEASGNYSIAMGEDSIASGNRSTAIGDTTEASGNTATAIGHFVTASGDYSMALGIGSNTSAFSSTAIGYSSSASGDYSIALGGSSASGQYSTTMGRSTRAPSYGETSIGYYNMTYVPMDSTAINNADKLFSIGNGTNNTNRSNALTIYKSGLMNINDEYDMPLTDGSTANQIMATDGSGHVNFVDASSVFTDTDNQNISGSGLSGTNLTIGIEGGTSETVDLSSLQDGTGTDDQTIDTFGFDNSSNILTLEIEDDGVAAQTIDLSVLDTGGDITAVTAGAGLTGGGTTGVTTVTAAANNGLNVDAGADRIQLGGALIQDTNIDYGNFDTRFNLDGTGDFIVQDNGSGVVRIDDAGNTTVSRSMTWKENNIAGTTIADLVDDNDDGLFTLYEGGIAAIVLDANGTSIFNEQGNPASDFRVESNGNTNMLFVNAGNNEVGVGGDPDTDLHVFHNDTAASAGFKIQNQGANNNWWRLFSSNATGNLFIYSTSGGAAPRGNFNNASGVYSATSDRRLKEDFKSLPFSWQNFMQLETLSYLYKVQKDNKRSLGLIAQDVEKIYPELVTYNTESDVYHLNYSGFGVVAIKAAQELKNEVDALKEENAVLIAKLNKLESLEARLTALEEKTISPQQQALPSNDD